MKKKWLIAVATIFMAITVAFGIVACGESGSSGKSDEEIAQSAVNMLNNLYLKDGTVKNYETPDDFKRLAQVKVEDTVYPVVWTADVKTQGYEENVKVGTEKDSSAQITIDVTRATADIEYTLTASVTVNSTTKAASYDHKIPKKSSESSLTATLDLSNDANRTKLDETNGEQVWSQNGVTLTNTGNVAKYSPIRLYKNTTVTIEMDNAKIIHIDFHSVQGYENSPYPEYLKSSIESSDLPIKGDVTLSEDGLTISVDFESPLEAVTFKTTAGQCRLTSIDVEAIERDPNEHVHAWEYQHVEGTWTHTATCTAEGCDVKTKTEDCTPKLNVCECGYTYSAKEIVDALLALEEGGSLPGTYSLTGEITAITDAYSTQYKNVTFEMTVDGRTVTVYRAKGTLAAEVEVGGTVTVNGELLDYSGTKEFTQGASIVEFIPGVDDRTPQQKVDAALQALEATFTVTKTGDTDLPASTVRDVTFTWSTNDQTYPIANNKITVSALPESNATVTATVTAACGTEAVTNNTKQVTITIRAQGSTPTPSEGDGSKDSPFTVSQALEIINGLDSYAYYTADGADPVPVYVQGIVTVAGTSDSYGIKNYYIADVADDQENDVLIYSLNWGTAVTSGTQVNVGDTILIQAYLQNYNGTPEITYWREGTTGNYTYHDGYVEAHTPAGGSVTPPPGPGGDTEDEFTPITTPKAGSDYYLAMMTYDGKYHYLTGSMAASPAQYYMATVTDIAQAVKVTLAGDSSNGWTLQCANGKYVEIEISGTHINAVYKDSSNGKWTWDDENDIFVWEIETKKYYLGTHGQSLTTVGGVDFDEHFGQSEQWSVVLGTVGTQGGSTVDPDPDAHVHNYTYEYDSATGWQHTKHCTAEGCTESDTTEACTPDHNHCSDCGHDFTEKEILDKLFGITGNSTVTLPGTYSLTGKVLRIDTAYNGEFGNVTFTIKVDDKEIQCYREKSDYSQSVKAGDTVTVQGTLKHYYNGTKEFDTGCEITNLTEGELTNAEKVSEALRVVTLPGTVSADVDLPASTIDGVTFSWQSNTESSIQVDGNKLKVTQTAQDVSVKITLTATCGSDATETKEFTVIVNAKLPEGATSKDMTYAGGTTTNMTGDNDAATFGFDASIFTIQSEKTNSGKNHVGLNTNGTIRLYSSESATLHISVATGYKIISIKVTLASATPANNSALKAVVGTSVVEGTKLTDLISSYAVDGAKISLSNTDSSKQVHISSITVIYASDGSSSQPVEDADEQKAQGALDAVGNNYTVDKAGDYDLPTSSVEGVTFTWEVSDDSGYTVEGGKLKVGDELPETEQTVSLKLTATCNGKTREKTVTITINAKEAKPTEQTTAIFSVAQYAEQNSWAAYSLYPEITIDENIKASLNSGSNNGKYNASYGDSKSEKVWGMYASENAVLTFTAENEATIVSVKIVYFSGDNGIICDSTKEITYESGTLISVNAKSLVLNIKNTNDKTNGKAFITSIEVIYTGGVHMSEQEKAEKALNDVNITESELTSNLTLPASTVAGTTLNWTVTKGQDAASVVDDVLQITRGDDDVEVTLSVTATCGEHTTSARTFTFTVKAKEVIQPGASKEITLDFVNTSAWQSGWNNQYAQHEVTFSTLGESSVTGSVVFSNASLQSSTFSDRPAVASKGEYQYVTVSVTDKVITAIEFDFSKWGDDALGDIHIEYTTDGSQWTTCSDVLSNSATQALASNITLPENVTSIRLSMKGNASKNRRLALNSIKVTVKDAASSASISAEVALLPSNKD